MINNGVSARDLNKRLNKSSKGLLIKGYFQLTVVQYNAILT